MPKSFSQHTLVLGFLLGVGVQLLMGAAETRDLEREIQQLRSEVSTTNRHLDQIGRSLDRMDDAYSSSGLKVLTAR
ncbi:MAG: hypothetical protein ACO1RX_13580 [Candidatus Sericytochromatia bacterium]